MTFKSYEMVSFTSPLKSKQFFLVLSSTHRTALAKLCQQVSVSMTSTTDFFLSNHFCVARGYQPPDFRIFNRIFERKNVSYFSRNRCLNNRRSHIFFGVLYYTPEQLGYPKYTIFKCDVISSEAIDFNEFRQTKRVTLIEHADRANR